MADPYGVPTLFPSNGPHNSHQQRTKTSGLRSFMGHKKTNSDGAALPSSFATSATQIQISIPSSANMADYGPGYHYLAPKISMQALGELQQNGQDQAMRSPERSPERSHDRSQLQQSPSKGMFATISLKALAGKDSSKSQKSKEPASPTKPKKSKSAANLGALLSRPKSIKNLKQLISDEEARVAKDKENRTPPSSVVHEYAAPPPIFAQFTSQQLASPASTHSLANDYFGRRSESGAERPVGITTEGGLWNKRPKSFQPPVSSSKPEPKEGRSKYDAEERGRKRMTWGKSGTNKNGFYGLGPKTKSTTSVKELFIDPNEIDKHLEAMLDRRNIPENQRYKMRNLSDTIKMEFIRQDWAEEQAKLERPETNGSLRSNDGSATGGSEKDEGKKKKHGRGLSLTIGKGSSSKGPSSPTKKSKGESSLGRHFRSKSTESVTSEHVPSTGEAPSNGGFFSKVKGQQRPADFVSYLRKVQKPELVEVGKLHKLRLLLRNETVAWTEEFIRQGGMEEIVGLLHRIMAIEWREEHEDALLHENLLCLKALCTTALALQYLHSIHASLFPALLHMIFDPEKKGPSEFTTRNIITSVLLTYIECATPQDRLSRAATVLGYLRDQQPKEEERPVDFVLEMRRERPYRVWCKEAVSVTKEVFWIFLHNLNVVAMPPSSNNTTSSDQMSTGMVVSSSTTRNPHTPGEGDRASDDQLAYMARHFPQERPPVPAAPYVGGVEWDATNYLASHLDLMNAIIACTGPTAEERNALRAELRISGWERCLGGSLRLCKEKFYGSVHDGLRTWVAAAAEDGWDVRDVRYGPPPESRSASPVKKPGGGRKKVEEPPKIEIPKLDFGISNATPVSASRPNDPWLS